MAVELSISNRAPMLPIDLSEDFMFALRKFCNVYGNKTMTQSALKILQSIPLVHSALAVKEADKMSAAQRNLAASKCMQEIAVPGFIKLVENALGTMYRPMPMPHKWKEMVYYTTLGTGTSKPKTFMEKQSTVLTKFKAYKVEYTKVWLWLDTNVKITPSELPSGTNTQDFLEELNDAMWFESNQYKREKAKADKADAESEALLSRGAAGSVDAAGSPAAGAGARGSVYPAGFPAGSPAAGAGAGESVDRAGSPPADAGPAAQAALAATEARQEPGSEAMLFAAAAANIRRELERKQDGHEGDEVPEWWVFPFLLLTAAYSPWSGQTPSEWKHLDSSDGPSKKRKGGDVTMDSKNPVCSPAVMSRLNPNGDAFSRRQHFATIKREKEQERKAAAGKELQDARKEALDSSDGPSKKWKGGDVTMDPENPVCSPAVMSRLNPNGDAFSRRQHFAAIKREKEQERKAAADKELQDARKEALDTKKKGLAALEAANAHVQTIGENMKRMVKLKEAEAVGIKRENRIKALEKKMMLRLGDQGAIRAELERLLDEW